MLYTSTHVLAQAAAVHLLLSYTLKRNIKMDDNGIQCVHKVIVERLTALPAMHSSMTAFSFLPTFTSSSEPSIRSPFSIFTAIAACAQSSSSILQQQPLVDEHTSQLSSDKTLTTGSDTLRSCTTLARTKLYTIRARYSILEHAAA
jgi:hypothetical protein